MQPQGDSRLDPNSGKKIIHCCISSLGPVDCPLGVAGSQLPQFFEIAQVVSALINQEMLGLTEEVHMQLTKLVALTQQCADQFQNQNAAHPSANIEIDHQRLRIKLGTSWIELESKPFVFRFIHRLAEKNSAAVTKQQLAQYLWPNQTYLPRTHDARLFDIAKRVRHLLASYPYAQVSLNSSHRGYQLDFKVGVSP